MSVSGLAGAQKVAVEERACRPPGAKDAKCNRGRPLLPGTGCQLLPLSAGRGLGIDLAKKVNALLRLPVAHCVAGNRGRRSI